MAYTSGVDEQFGSSACSFRYNSYCGLDNGLQLREDNAPYLYNLKNSLPIEMTESNQKWYVLRAMSGKEKQVKEYIDIELEKGGELSKYVSQVVIPTERVYVVRNGKKVIKERTFLPGYVLIEVALTREISGWLRNVPNVLGFLGVNESPGNYQPIPLRSQEVTRLLGTVDSLDENPEELLEPYLVGETVRVITGPFNGFTGVVEEVSNEKRRMKVNVKIFGRNTTLELGFMQVEKE